MKRIRDINFTKQTQISLEMEKKVKRNGDERINSLTQEQISGINALAFGTMLFKNDDDFEFTTFHSRALAHRQRALGVDGYLGTTEYSRAFLEALSQVKSIFDKRASLSNTIAFESNYSVFDNRPCALFSIYEMDPQLGYRRTYHYNYFLMGTVNWHVERSRTHTSRLYVDNWYDLYSFNWQHVRLIHQGKHTNCIVTKTPNTRLTPGMWVIDRDNSVLKGWKVIGDRHVFVCLNLSDRGPILTYHIVRDKDDMVDLMAHIFDLKDEVCDFSDYSPVYDVFNNIFELALSLSELQTNVKGSLSEGFSMIDDDPDHTSAFILALKGLNPNLSIF